MQENPFSYVIERAKRTLFLPIYKYIYTLKQSTNPRLLLSRALLKVSSGLRGLFVIRPQKASDYFYAGRLGIYKKLAILLILLICLAPVIYFQFFSVPVSAPVEEETAAAEFVFNDPALEGFSGNARILSVGKKLVYEGAVEKGLCTGKGKLYNTDGSLLYSGDFADNEYNGAGELFDSHGSPVYSGGFANNEYNGAGRLYYPSGTLNYEGAFEAGMYNGAGILYSENGSVLYNGSFVDNIYSGEGILFDAATSRTVYQGDFVNGLYEGTGTLYSAVGRGRFSGPFLKGLPDYVYFLNLPTPELGKYFLEPPETASGANMSASLTYRDMKVTLMHTVPGEAAEAEAETAELSEPAVCSVIVYDNTLPAGLEGMKEPSDFEALLGAPVYEGCSFPLDEDLIALEALAERGVLTEKDALYPGAADAYDSELYLACYDYQGFALTLFFDKKDGKFLYYRWDI